MELVEMVPGEEKLDGVELFACVDVDCDVEFKLWTCDWIGWVCVWICWADNWFVWL